MTRKTALPMPSIEDEPTANEAIEDLKSSGVIPRGDIDEEFWQEVGRYKDNIRRVSLADCFAIALANRVEGELATSNHGEFDPIAAQNIWRIRFIG
ncbi:MAG: type II toxin-antitoxin system VapC family toxin [Rubrobacteraceae bacterium]